MILVQIGDLIEDDFAVESPKDITDGTRQGPAIKFC